MSPTVSRVLIANRGEIACRIIAACRELGLRSVAVYSDADRDALHVRQADAAVRLGEAAPQASYLAIDRLIAAAADSGADALHPGYGFRAESAELASACEAAGLVFLGPRPDTLRALGDKRAARELARTAGVPVVPGYEGGAEGAAAAARELGYPVLVKAAAGGGGKGMRKVTGEADLDEALSAAARVAAGAFGDASVYLERCLENARHIEVQILGDGDGAAVHLHERECSLQRRHQKVIEESPSPGIDDALRRKITDAAVALARTARYRSAGTCEFLVGADGEFYFLEMNTRIQVEHPVTELVTGFDLVKAQLELPASGQLPAQDAIVPRGVAIEARLTAEDTAKDFLPQAGKLVRFDIPHLPFLRVDTGFEAGGEVPVHYDSLLAKLIVWGRTRDEALARLRSALDGTVVHGIRTNLPLLRYLVRHPKVIAGELSTTLLETELMPQYLHQIAQPTLPLLVAAAALDETLRASARRGPSTGGAAPPDVFRALGRYRLSGVG